MSSMPTADALPGEATKRVCIAIVIAAFIFPAGRANACDDADKECIHRVEAANTATTPPAVLAELARDKDPEVRAWVASNAATPKKILALLANDPASQVRQHLAISETSPPRL